MKIKAQFKNKKNLWTLLLVVGVMLYACGLAVLSEGAAQQSGENFKAFLQSDWAPIALGNVALLAGLLILALTWITRRLSVSVGLVSVVIYGFHVANAMKMYFRNEPVYPWDLSLLGEVGNIASSMKFPLTGRMIAGGVYVLLGLAGAILLDIFCMKKLRRRYWKELTAGLIVLAVFCGSSWLLLGETYLQKQEVSFVSWDTGGSYQKNGFVYAFAASGYSAQIEAADNYDEKTVTAIAETAAVTAAADTAEKVQPNVIIIMSEAFTDIQSASALEYDRELTPNFNCLAENYLSGRCMTSEFGGGTANSEFEVLTGYSTYDLPSGTIAYMNYVNQDVDSYVSYLNGQDYYTVALHPYQRTFFSREKAYGVLGFDAFYSEESFADAERVRKEGYVSDAALTERIIAEYESNQGSGRPFFCHAVSMQNHASYLAEEYAEQVGLTAHAELSDAEYAALQTYATGISLSDQALGTLVDYFSQTEEPTVILFFGDHMPSLTGDTYALAERIGYVSDSDSPEGKFKLQSTPYLIWNNFQETPTHAEQDLSMFHLVPYMTRLLGMERPVFHYYMDSLFETLPGVTRQAALTDDGQPLYQPAEEARTKLEEYLLLVYDGLLGKRYANGILY